MVLRYCYSVCKTLVQQMNENTVMIPPDTFSRLRMANKCVCSRCSAPDPAGERTALSQTLPAGLRGLTSNGRGGKEEKGTELKGKGEGEGKRGVSHLCRGKGPARTWREVYRLICTTECPTTYRLWWIIVFVNQSINQSIKARINTFAT